MIDKLMQIFDGQGDQTSIFGLLRLVRFDSDPQQPVKPFQKYIGVSYNIQDVRGNPGSPGNFFITNLRMIWQMKSDPTINLSFGWDTVILSDVKSIPAQIGDGYKHVLTIKVQNPSQTRYQFKFSGSHRDDQKVFQKVIQIHKKILKTKQYRSTNITLKVDQEYEPLQNQQIKSTYDNITVVEEQSRARCKVYVTDVRLVIIKQNEKKSNLGISWIMIRGIQYSAESDVLKGIRLHCRGLMAARVIFLYAANGAQSKNFCQIYNKTPILGYSYEPQPQKQHKIKQLTPQIEQFQITKVNIGRRKNAYASSGDIGNLEQAQFNKEIGLMMEKLPQGVQVSDLWKILM